MNAKQGRSGGLMRKAGESVHAASLAAWLGATFMSGVVAAVVFPLMRELEPRVGARYANYEGDHPNLLAGILAERVFFAADVVSFAGASLALATAIGLVAFGGIELKRWSSGIRLCALGLALGLLSYKLFMLDPPMSEHLHSYREAAAANLVETAQTHREAFGAMHPTASRVLGAIAITTLIGLVSGVWSAAGAREGRTP